MAMERHGLVYILQTPIGMKIGRTHSILKRMKDLSRQYEVRFIHALVTHDMAGLERILHERFQQRRIIGAPSREIFALTLGDVEQIKAIRRFRGKPCLHIDTLEEMVAYQYSAHRLFHLDY